MNANEVKEIPYAEKKLLVSEMCLMYKKLSKTDSILKKKIVDREKNMENKLEDSVYTNMLEARKSVSIFEAILSLMSPAETLIIQKDFIEHGNAGWYKDIWAKTTYYKIKHKAIDVFLTLMYV